jgi:hypothetical protein
VLGPANLALKFLLEVAALAAFAFWGASTGEMPLSLALAISTPVVAAIAWGVFAAPKSKRRLPLPSRVRFEVIFFVAAVLALLSAGAPGLAVAMAVLVILNTTLLTVLGQWQH